MKIKDYKLFTVGPAQMYQNTLHVRNHIVPYFRTSEFSMMMLETIDLLKKFEHAEENSEVIILTISQCWERGSGLWPLPSMPCISACLPTGT